MVNKRPVILLLLVVAIVIFPLALYHGQGEGYFGGADDSAGGVIEETGYQPWFSSIWEPPSSEIESLLFATQAAVGAIIIGYVLGYYRCQAKTRKRKMDENTKTNEIE